jgi:3-dehydrosphinganine reductase
MHLASLLCEVRVCIFYPGSGYHSQLLFSSGLAETLRSELQLYGIDVHVYCPAGILSPHYYVEQTFKPEITKKIEEGDTPISPEASAGLLLKGI